MPVPFSFDRCAAGRTGAVVCPDSPQNGRSGGRRFETHRAEFVGRGCRHDRGSRAEGGRQAKRRHVEIVLAFRELLAGDERIVRSPSHYAAALHISPVYLNEVVKGVTGENVSGYIQSEILLRARRMLVYTQQQIGEIARTLGFDDCAYFTRLFTQRTGMSPTSYREKYLG